MIYLEKARTPITASPASQSNELQDSSRFSLRYRIKTHLSADDVKHVAQTFFGRLDSNLGQKRVLSRLERDVTR